MKLETRLCFWVLTFIPQPSETYLEDREKDFLARTENPRRQENVNVTFYFWTKNRPQKINVNPLAAKWQPCTDTVKSKDCTWCLYFYFPYTVKVQNNTYAPATVYFKLCYIHCTVLPHIDLTICFIMFLPSVLNSSLFLYFLKSTDQNTVGPLAKITLKYWHICVWLVLAIYDISLYYDVL